VVEFGRSNRGDGPILMSMIGFQSSGSSVLSFLERNQVKSTSKQPTTVRFFCKKREIDESCFEASFFEWTSTGVCERDMLALTEFLHHSRHQYVGTFIA
jgi:hypothetical protein